MKNVCILQPVMKAYRLPFFIGLAERLSQSGIQLQVVYGTPWAEEAKRGDHVVLDAPLGHRVKSWMVGKLYLQPVVLPWLRADLVIVEHANKHLLNYVLCLLRALGLKRIAYWGHGRDRQSDPSSPGETFKRLSLHWADWWFAYTEGSAKYVVGQRFDGNKVTIVENAIDTRAFRRDLSSITAEERQDFLERLGWAAASRVGIYCGSLYPNKRLDLLLGAASRVHRVHPDFRLLIVGNGPSTEEVLRFAAERPWVQFVGPKFDREKALCFAIAEMALNPGLVGLGILDAFCAGIPFLTTDLPLHSPEIEYLTDGHNGLILSPTEDGFASGVAALITDSGLLQRLAAGAILSSQRQSIETMVENFAYGVEQCLAQ